MKKTVNYKSPIKPSRQMRKGPMDRVLFTMVVLLMTFGTFMVFSSSAPYAIRRHGNPYYFLKRDLIWSAMGLFVMVFVSFIDYRKYKKYARFFYLFSMILCVLCFVPVISKPTNYAHRWIGTKQITIMPSDLVKISSVLYLSSILTKDSIQKNGSALMFFKVMFFVALTVIPIYIQPNFSAVIVIAFTLLSLYFIGGMNLIALIPMLAVVGGGLTVAFWPKEGNYRLDRLKIVFDPLKDAKNKGWQLMQSLFAVSTGGLFGVGYGKSRQKFDYLADEPHNDFIFSVISEELGFIGASFFILFYVYMIYRCVKASSQARTPYGRLVGYGLSIVLAFQAMVNIGVSIGLVPPTGITLPFISYGGSSLMAMCTIMGIILNISRDEN